MLLYQILPQIPDGAECCHARGFRYHSLSVTLRRRPFEGFYWNMISVKTELKVQEAIKQEGSKKDVIQAIVFKMRVEVLDLSREVSEAVKRDILGLSRELTVILSMPNHRKQRKAVVEMDGEVKIGSSTPTIPLPLTLPLTLPISFPYLYLYPTPTTNSFPSLHPTPLTHNLPPYLPSPPSATTH